ncbi:MAG TPA: hypothetical protein V6D17_11055 [Candidatus Obscuribacterales bacterium]
MKHQIEHVESARQTIVVLLRRIDQVKANAASRDWPYAHVQPSLRIFVHDLADAAEKILRQAGEKLLFTTRERLEEPVSPSHFAAIGERYAKVANDAASSADVAEANCAIVEALWQEAQRLILRAERCLEGDETLSGETIHHGALYYK